MPSLRVLAAAVMLLALSSRARAEDRAPMRLSLADAVAHASGASSVALAGLHTRESEEKARQARAAFLPTLSGSASEVNRTLDIHTLGLEFPAIPGGPAFPTLVGPFDVVDARLRATQTLFDYASWARLRSARHDVSVSRAEATTTSEGAARTSALAYLRIARAQATVAARQADVGLAGDLLTLAQAQLKAGTGVGIDVTRAKAQLTTASGQLTVARNQLDRAHIDLARALGLDAWTRFEIADTLADGMAVSTAPTTPEDAAAFALERRPELRVERERLARARADRLAVNAERLPRLEAAADYGSSGRHFSDAIATRELSVSASVPLFDGLRREARAAEQDAIAREAETRERDLRQQVVADVRGAELDLESGIEQERVASEQLALAEQEVAQARDRFVNGIAGNIEVINAQVSLLRARDAEIEARFATASARVDLARAAGVAQTLH